MVTATRFGRKLKLPSTVQIKRELLLCWLADQKAKEAAESVEAARTKVVTGEMRHRAQHRDLNGLLRHEISRAGNAALRLLPSEFQD
jgi:hypothetical protein